MRCDVRRCGTGTDNASPGVCNCASKVGKPRVPQKLVLLLYLCTEGSCCAAVKKDRCNERIGRRKREVRKAEKYLRSNLTNLEKFDFPKFKICARYCRVL